MNIFEGKTTLVESLIQTIKDEVRIKLAAMKYSLEEGPDRELMEKRWGATVSARIKNIMMVSLCKPPEGVMKLNTDGSLRHRRGSWGAALRDANGYLFKVAHGRSPWTAIDEIEMDGIEQGLRLTGK